MNTDLNPDESKAAEEAARRKKLIDELAESTRVRLGEERIKKLAKTAPCIAQGGFDAVLHKAAEECHGYDNAAAAVTCRTVQLCGSVPKKEDRA